MSIDERHALEALLVQMRAIHAELAQHHAGVCVLHIEAAVAALESHLRRIFTPQAEMPRHELSSALGAH